MARRRGRSTAVARVGVDPGHEAARLPVGEKAHREPLHRREDPRLQPGDHVGRHVGVDPGVEDADAR